MNSLLTLASNYSEKRCMMKNDHNGHAYMSCVIIDKSTQYVLRDWDKPVQC